MSQPNIIYNNILDIVLSKLNLENDEPAIKRYTSGHHHTYDINDEYIIKIQDSKSSTLKHQSKFLDLVYKKGALVPQPVDFGEEGSFSYLVTKKIKGNNVAQDWIRMSDIEKEEIFKSVISQIKIFHSIDFHEYRIPVVLSKNGYRNLMDAVNSATDFSVLDKNKFAKKDISHIEYLESFLNKNLRILDEENTAKLVHNDIHLENIIWDGVKFAGIIDFDWVCQAPIDYELWKIIEIIRQPRHSVNGELVPLGEPYALEKYFHVFKESYPELFLKPNLANRIRLYHIQEIIGNRFLDFQNAKISKIIFSDIDSEMSDIYYSDWLDNLLVQ